MIKRVLVAIMILALAATLAGCGQKDAKTADQKTAAKLNFRLAEMHPPDHPTAQADKEFAKLVADRSQGRIKIDVFVGAQLGEEKAIIEQVQLGAIEFARVSSGPLGEFNKQLGVFSLPYIFNSDDHMWKYLNGPGGEKMLKDLETSKFVGLAYFTAGSRNFYSKKPITKLEDLSGMKVRVIQNKINIDMIQALGGSATPMPAGEVFSGLQTGVIDAAENNWPTFSSSNHYQVAKYWISDAHQRVPEMLIMSKAAWDKLSDDDKKLIKQAAADSVKIQRELWAKSDKEAEAKVRAAGVSVIEVKDLKPWQDAVKPVIEKYGTEYKETLAAIAEAGK
ncbi:MAG: TRAP transporter substrate-binding protein [Sporomusaceae bacterium]|nr:TRAP transporter substrate-binding protein [Sporomusaceae bacterium]